MVKFKVGDKIVRLEQWIDQSFPSITEIHEVKESYKGKITVKKYPHMELYWNEDRFKLYEEPVMANETKKPRVHVALIKAWADGAAIQRETNGEWRDVVNPLWDENVEYRIKPEPKPDVVKYVCVTNNMDPVCPRIGLSSAYNTFPPPCPYGALPVGNIKIILDGETGKLKDAKVIG